MKEILDLGRTRTTSMHAQGTPKSLARIRFHVVDDSIGIEKLARAQIPQATDPVGQ